MRYTIFIVIVVVLTTVILRGENSSEKTTDEAREYEIISALVRSYLGSDFGLIVINEQTESWCITTPLNVLREKWKSLKHETVDSLIMRNSLSVKLKNKLSLNTNYRLISRHEYIEVLQDSVIPNWDNFDRVFPDSPGFLTVSRVGFDSQYSQALIYFTNAYRCSDDLIIPRSRNIAYFMKKDDTWVFKGIEKGFYTMYSY